MMMPSASKGGASAGPPRLTVKRVFDFSLASVAFLVTAPLMAAVALAVLASSRGPVLFLQVRHGFCSRPFRLVKFRTMRLARPDEDELMTDGVRLTRVGRFLRATSLDELPQLWNVILGDMSLVGPRPLVQRYTPYLTESERLRFTVRPGVTGWAQIKGRNTASWDERLAMDVWYVKNRSFWLDIKILFLTVLVVLRREGTVVDARSIMKNLDEERSDWPHVRFGRGNVDS
jgi:lipopolysaccharide/colanic/teichoic acid biosynthesis glycosyltransferase